MERKTHLPDCIARHTVVFTADEVKQILHKAAQDAGRGLPEDPTFIWWPDLHSYHSERRDIVTLGVDVKEEH